MSLEVCVVDIGSVWAIIKFITRRISFVNPIAFLRLFGVRHKLSIYIRLYGVIFC